MSTRLHSSDPGRLFAQRGGESRESASAAFDVTDIVGHEPSEPRGLDGIDDILTLAQSGRGIGLHQAGSRQEIQVPIKARAADVHRALKAADGRRAKNAQGTQNLSLGATAHDADCELNLGGKCWSDEVGHGSILPDTSGADGFGFCPTLLLNNSVDAAATVSTS